ncbi:AAA family ATPase [Streptomyces sp. NPDC086010]|uniref:ATP-binding protein n=1 Tax=Streptomyces sp. NPDC086010 TaxID=3365745 RepID=UPI0037D58A22
MNGEPGVGKTALLDQVAGRAGDFRVCRITSVQSKMELAFSGLHLLCAPMMEGVGRLPDAQGDALRAAIGLGGGWVPDRFLVGLATLGLLAEASRERPLLCLVDDAQWLDRASVQVLAFTARRLQAESVALVFAARVADEVPAGGAGAAGAAGGTGGSAGAGGRWSACGGGTGLVAFGAARAVGRAGAGADRGEARGNPLALLELSRESSPAELAGGFGLPGTRALTGRIQELYRRRFARLPVRTRLLLLVAAATAAEPSGEPALLWRAADRLGIGIEAVTPAVSAELVRIDDHVRFRHPLVRSAVYWVASSEERCRAHRALAEATDAGTDPDRRAWHAAQGTQRADEDVAVRLEHSAGRARPPRRRFWPGRWS